jgi:hypothetical protein
MEESRLFSIVLKIGESARRIRGLTYEDQRMHGNIHVVAHLEAHVLYSDDSKIILPGIVIDDSTDGN